MLWVHLVTVSVEVERKVDVAAATSARLCTELRLNARLRLGSRRWLENGQSHRRVHGVVSETSFKQ